MTASRRERRPAGAVVAAVAIALATLAAIAAYNAWWGSLGFGHGASTSGRASNTSPPSQTPTRSGASGTSPATATAKASTRPKTQPRTGSEGGRGVSPGAWVAREVRAVKSLAPKLSGKPYASLGYPTLRLPEGGVNVTYGVLISNASFLKLGYVHEDVEGLQQAWRECVRALNTSIRKLLPNATAAQLRHVGFSLVSAYLSGGEVANDTLVRRPVWFLNVALTWDGVRLASVGGGTLWVEVDGLGGNVTIDWRDAPHYVLPPPNLSVVTPNSVSNESVVKAVERALTRFLSESASSNSTPTWMVSYAREALNLLKHGCLASKPDLILARLDAGGSLSRTSLASNVVGKGFEGVWRLYWLVSVGGNYSVGIYKMLVSVDGDSLAAISHSPIYPSAPYWLGLSVSASPAGGGVNATVVREVRVGGKVVEELVTLENAVNLSRAWGVVVDAAVVTHGPPSLTIRRNGTAELTVSIAWPPNLKASASPSTLTLAWCSGQHASATIRGPPAGRLVVKEVSKIPAVIVKVVCRWSPSGGTASYYAAVPAVA